MKRNKKPDGFGEHDRISIRLLDIQGQPDHVLTGNDGFVRDWLHFPLPFRCLQVAIEDFVRILKMRIGEYVDVPFHNAQVPLNCCKRHPNKLDLEYGCPFFWRSSTYIRREKEASCSLPQGAKSTAIPFLFVAAIVD
eukprot:scpid94561/ scgid6345/ 